MSAEVISDGLYLMAHISVSDRERWCLAVRSGTGEQDVIAAAVPRQRARQAAGMTSWRRYRLALGPGAA